MSFLDRFKPQPRWRHADPAVRAEAVHTIPDDEEHLAVLRELAGTDPDLRVRRAAGSRLAAVEDLVQLARSEADEDLRREYTERLVSVATAGAGTDASAALALAGLDDQKHFAAIAKGSPHDTVRAAALGRIHDTRLLSSVARHAADAQTSADAVARVADPAELWNIALKTEHKDAAISALDRALAAAGDTDTRELLDGLATRARSKAVARRARGIIQAMDDAAAARKTALEQWQQRVAQLVARAEAIAAAPYTADAAEQLADTESDWRAVAAETTFALDADTMARFESSTARAREEMARLAREEAERVAAEERRQETMRRREALCEKAEAIRGEDTPAQIDAVRAEWVTVEASDGAAVDTALQARFDEACARAAERHHRREELQQVAQRLEEVTASAETAAARDDLPEEAWRRITAEWTALSAQVGPVDEGLAARFEAAAAAVRTREEHRRAAAERALRQQVQRLEQLIERATKRAAAEDLTLREADRIFRDLRTATEAPPDLPAREQQALFDRLRQAQGLVGPRLHELREMDEWKRFANAAVQEELIARAEALRAKYPFDAPDQLKAEDLDHAARELHEIQDRWKQAADAPRAQAQALWHRYRQAVDPIQIHVRDFFSKRAEERKGNLDRKMALIERAEAIADSTEWVKTADEFKKLQAEWQAIGPVPRQDTRTTWKRFREACDRFFTRRNADLAQRKETWAANLAQKEALIARAEALSVSTEWERAAAEIRRLQAEWKTSGPVRRNKSEVVWQRFRAACDTFFDRYKRRDQIEIEAKQADREGLVTEMESLAAAPSGEGTALLERVRSLRSRWNQSTPVVRQGADPLSARFVAAIERLITAAPEAFKGTELDVEANRHRMDKLIAKVEGFVNETGTPSTASQDLASMLREALASNTIGGRGSEEAKWKAMAEEVRQAQQSWSRLGPVPGDGGRELSDRFHKACGRFFDIYRRKVPHSAPGGGGERRGRPVGAR
jgi:hypothetical protein